MSPHVMLGEVISLEYGRSLPASARRGGSVPVYGSNGRTGWHNEALIPGPSIIVGRKGSIGRVHYYDGPSFPIDTTYYVRAREGVQIDFRFAYYMLREAKLNKLNSATGVPSLNREHAYKVKTRVPSVPEQRRIVRVLDRAAEIRRRAGTALTKARVVIPALFVDMFGDPSTNPKGWHTLTLGEALHSGPQNGLYRPASDYGEGTRILRIDSFDDGCIDDQRNLKRLQIDSDNVRKYRLCEGDVVINRVNSPPQLGKSVLIPQLEEPTVFESNMMRMRMNREILMPMVAGAMLQLDSVRQSLIKNAKHAINQSSINQGDVKGLTVFAPPLPLQMAFTEQARRVESAVRALDAAAAKAAILGAALSAEVFG